MEGCPGSGGTVWNRFGKGGKIKFTQIRRDVTIKWSKQRNDDMQSSQFLENGASINQQFTINYTATHHDYLPKFL